MTEWEMDNTNCASSYFSIGGSNKYNAYVRIISFIMHHNILYIKYKGEIIDLVLMCRLEVTPPLWLL